MKKFTFFELIFAILGPSRDDAVSTIPKPIPVDLTVMHWQIFPNDIDKEKFGEYILNPEMQKFTTEDFERIVKEEKFKIIEIKEYIGKKYSDVVEGIIKKYSSDYYIPGIEFWRWNLENYNKAPANFKDSNDYLFLGSLIRDGEGHWDIIGLTEGEGEFGLNLFWFGSENTWGETDRVVLIQR